MIGNHASPWVSQAGVSAWSPREDQARKTAGNSCSLHAQVRLCHDAPDDTTVPLLILVVKDVVAVRRGEGKVQHPARLVAPVAEHHVLHRWPVIHVEPSSEP